MRKNLYECLSQIKSNEKFERCNNFIGVDEKPHTNTLCEMEVESLNLFWKVGLKRGIFQYNDIAYSSSLLAISPKLILAPAIADTVSRPCSVWLRKTHWADMRFLLELVLQEQEGNIMVEIVVVIAGVNLEILTY